MHLPYASALTLLILISCGHRLPGEAVCSKGGAREVALAVGSVE